MENVFFVHLHFILIEKHSQKHQIMRRNSRFIFLITFICLLTASFAQNNTDYPVKVINGTEYYVYKVQAGEGLYSISKRFNVSQSEINNLNPQIQDGLHAGEDILIPKKAQKNTKNIDNEQSKESFNTNYIQHKVKKKQTIFAISRIYNISQEDILKANPQAADGIHEGDILLIPQKNNEETSLGKDQKETKQKKEKNSDLPLPNLHIGKDANYILYTVQQGETLYSISKRYNASIDEIVKLNPDVVNGLQTGSQLRIPFNQNKVSNTATSTTTAVVTKPTVKLQENKDTYKIAFLLPFMLDEKTPDATVNKFLDFYMGALLAVKNAQNSGINYEIYTYDTEKSEEKIYSIINLPEMQKMDLIIGPAYSVQTPILADFAKRHQIYTVVPFSSNVDDIEDNPYIFQFNPDKDLQSYFIANLLKKDFRDANVIIADVNTNLSDEEKDYFEIIVDKLNRSGVPFTEISKSDFTNNKIESLLDKDKKNILIFNTYEYVSVQSYLANLYDLSKKYDVGVIGQYAWKSEIGKKPKMYYVAPFKDDAVRLADSGDYEKEFSLYYGKTRGDKNPRYDMIGYDLTNYFLSLMTKNGFSLTESAMNLKNNEIQSDLFFKKLNSKGGFMNQKLFLIENEAKRH